VGNFLIGLTDVQNHWVRGERHIQQRGTASG
jgi:hypothetical protein